MQVVAGSSPVSRSMNCPICDKQMQDDLHLHTTAVRCPEGHYREAPMGCYGREFVVNVDGKDEIFILDDAGPNDLDKLSERIKQLRLAEKLQQCGFGDLAKEFLKQRQLKLPRVNKAKSCQILEWKE